MKIVTNWLVHTNMTYYDIKSAGPKCLEILGLDYELVKISNKQQRNVQYGKKLKELGLQNYIPWLLTSFSKILCYELHGIIYTQDSVITNKDIRNSILNKITDFYIRPKWTSSILIIDIYRKSYIAQTDSDIIIKGTELPPLLIKKLFRFLLSKNWLFMFKKWFLNHTKNIKYFITNKNRIKLESGWVENITHPEFFNHLISKVDKHFYWRKLLPFFQSIEIFYYKF